MGVLFQRFATPYFFWLILSSNTHRDSNILKQEEAVIQRNTDIVQYSNAHVCGHLCLHVLPSLTREHCSFQDVLSQLNDGYTQGDW